VVTKLKPPLQTACATGAGA